METTIKKAMTIEERMNNIENSRRLAKKAESKAIVLVKEHNPMGTVDNWIHILTTDATRELSATEATYQLFRKTLEVPKITNEDIRQELLHNDRYSDLYEDDRTRFNKILKREKTKKVRQVTAEIRDKDIAMQIENGVNPRISAI